MKGLIYASIAVAAVLAVHQAHSQSIIIANPSVKSAQVSTNEIRDVFSGSASTLKDGSHVTPVLLKQGAAHEAFLSAYLGKSDSAFRAAWRNLVFTGNGSMPKSFDSEAALVEFVEHNPGAIGYIGSGTPHEGVKVIAVK
ncbi:hypothetical protein DYQ86_23105 [Acidobacteria bacterium AB60]|nr:hypothetical protein DYQ86_23105 [Acidobacteria bacterium AB60]